MTNLSGVIKSIQNIMREDHGVDGDAQRLSQLCWLLFLKIFDEKEEEEIVSEPPVEESKPAAVVVSSSEKKSLTKKVRGSK